MLTKRPRPTNIGEGCQYVFEDGRRCANPFPARAWRYCVFHKESGPKQTKSITQKRGNYVKDHRSIYSRDEEYKLRNRNDQFRHQNGLTKPKLQPFLNRAETLQEEDSFRAEFHQDALDRLNNMMRRLLNSRAFLPRDAATVVTVTLETYKLLADLEESQRDGRHDPVTHRLILYTKKFLRDIGRRQHPEMLTTLRRDVQRVRELWRQHGELLNVVHALLVDVEIFRIQYIVARRYQSCVNSRFFNNLRTHLDAAEFLCEFALSRTRCPFRKSCTSAEPSGSRGAACCAPPVAGRVFMKRTSRDRQKKLVHYLRFYIDGVKVCLSFDAGELEEAAKHLEVLRQRAAAFADTYSTGKIVATVRFLSAMMGAEYHLRLKNFDQVRYHLNEAEDLLSECRSGQLLDHFYFVRESLAIIEDDSHPFNLKRMLHDLKQFFSKEENDPHPCKAPEVRRPKGEPMIFIHSYLFCFDHCVGHVWSPRRTSESSNAPCRWCEESSSFTGVTDIVARMREAILFTH